MDQELIDLCYSFVEKEDMLEGWRDHIDSRQRIAAAGASFLVVFNDHQYCAFVEAACHGQVRLLCSPRDKRDGVAVVTMCIPIKTAVKHGWTEEGILEYYRYIANDGPCKDLFVTKDPIEMIERGCIINPVKAVGARLLMALIQTRFPWELTMSAPIAAKMYEALVKHGAHPNLSAIISSGISLKTYEEFIMVDDILPSRVGQSHLPWSWLGRTKTDWKGVLRNKPVNLLQELWEDGGYYGVHAMFDGKSGLTPLDRELVDDLGKAIERWRPKCKEVGRKGCFDYRCIPLEPQNFEGLFQDLAEVLIAFKAKVLTPVKRSPSIASIASQNELEEGVHD